MHPQRLPLTAVSQLQESRVDHSPHTALVEACAQPLALVSTPERALECHAGHCISRDAFCVVACELSGEHHMAVSDVGTACAWLVEMSQCREAFFSPSNTATTVRLCCSKSRGRHNHRACTLHRALCCGRVGVRLRKQGQQTARVGCEQVAQNSKLRQSGWVPRIAICMPVSLRSCVREVCPSFKGHNGINASSSLPARSPSTQLQARRASQARPLTSYGWSSQMQATGKKVGGTAQKVCVVPSLAHPWFGHLNQSTALPANQI